MLMWDVIAFCAFLASIVSFYSGFGLGTILMPVMALFFPLPIAISCTAAVHLFHNLIKTGLLYKAIDWSIAWRFGLASIIGAIPGALLLKGLSKFGPVKHYTLFDVHATFSLMHFLIGLLLVLFATLQLPPRKPLKLKNLLVGGALSGFFGGLSGYQGAFRSTFLVNTQLTKEAFIATNALIATAVDIIRLTIYALTFQRLLHTIPLSLFSVAIGGAVLGIVLGMLLLPKTSIAFIEKGIVVILYLFGFLLMVGVI